MATDAERDALIAYVGGRAGVAEDQAFAVAKWDEAVALVTKYLGIELNSVPASVRIEATKDVAANLWARKGAPSGQAQWDTVDAAPVSVHLDPLAGVYPVLNRFLSGGFA